MRLLVLFVTFKVSTLALRDSLNSLISSTVQFLMPCLATASFTYEEVALSSTYTCRWYSGRLPLTLDANMKPLNRGSHSWTPNALMLSSQLTSSILDMKMASTLDSAGAADSPLSGSMNSKTLWIFDSGVSRPFRVYTCGVARSFWPWWPPLDCSSSISYLSPRFIWSLIYLDPSFSFRASQVLIGKTAPSRATVACSVRVSESSWVKGIGLSGS